MFAWISGPFGGKIAEGVVQCWPQWTPSYFWGCYLCGTLAKIDQQNKCDCESADRQTDRQTDTRTDGETNWIYNLSHAICYSYGTNKK